MAVFLESFEDAILNLELAMKHEVELHEYSRRDTMPTEDDDVKKIVQKTKLRKISIQKSIDKLEEDEEESEGETFQILKPQYPGGVPLSEDRLVNFASQLDSSKTGQSEIEKIKIKTVEKISEVIDKTYQEASLESKEIKKYEELDSGIQIDGQERPSEDEPESGAESEAKVTSEEKATEDNDIEVKILKPIYPGGAELNDKERMKELESQLQKTQKKIGKEAIHKAEKTVVDAIKAGVGIEKTPTKDAPDPTREVLPENTSEETPEHTPESTPGDIPEDQQNKAEIEDVKVKIMKPQFPGGAVPNANRLKDFDKQLVSGEVDLNGLESETQKIVAKTTSNKDNFMKTTGKFFGDGLFHIFRKENFQKLE